MRTLPLSLAGTVILVLLGGLDGGTVAQTEDESTQAAEPYPAVPGSASGGHQVGQQEMEYSEALPEVRVTGYDWWLETDTDDPRLTGRYLTTQNYNLVFRNDDFSGALRSGQGRLVTDGGSWAGEFKGFTKPGTNVHFGNHYVDYLTGEGDYSGLTAMLLFLPSGPHAWAVEGVIFPGSMPGAPSELPTE